MVEKSRIEENLKKLEKHFDGAQESTDLLFFSKLALLELCGWIEETMDVIVVECASSHLTDSKNVQFVQDHIVEETSSFSYNKFRDMLMRVVGLVWVERLENRFDPLKVDPMKSTLGGLRKQRDSAAHTHISGTTLAVEAPSKIYGHYNRVCEGLEEIERCIKALNV